MAALYANNLRWPELIPACDDTKRQPSKVRYVTGHERISLRIHRNSFDIREYGMPCWVPPVV